MTIFRCYLNDVNDDIAAYLKTVTHGGVLNDVGKKLLEQKSSDVFLPAIRLWLSSEKFCFPIFCFPFCYVVPNQTLNANCVVLVMQIFCDS